MRNDTCALILIFLFPQPSIVVRSFSQRLPSSRAGPLARPTPVRESGSGGLAIKLERLRRDREVLALAAEVRAQLLDMERRGHRREPRLPGQPAGAPRLHRAPRGGQQEAAAPQRCRGRLRRRRCRAGSVRTFPAAMWPGFSPIPLFRITTRLKFS